MSIGSVEKICGLSEAESLHNPFTNLSCGVKLLHHYVTKDNRISEKSGENYYGGARYWAVLRPGRHDFLTSIQTMTKNFCVKLD